MSTKSQLQGGGRYGIRTWGFVEARGGRWEVLVDLVGTSLDEVLPEAYDFLNAFSMNCITLMPFIFLSASFLISSLLLVKVIPSQDSGCS